MHWCEKSLLRAFLNWACLRLSLPTTGWCQWHPGQPSFCWRQQTSRSQVVTGPQPFARIAWRPPWGIQKRSHYFLLCVLLSIMAMNIALLLESCWIFHNPENIYEGPSGGCFLGGLMDLTIWLPLNPMQSLEKLPLTRGPAAFHSQSFMCGTKN